MKSTASTMKILFLGTGTSVGVPQIGCQCPVCRSIDPLDKRLRASAVVQTGNANILIDCGPDFREQMLRARSMPLDFALFTHIHYDHVGGVDDLRPYCGHSHRFPVFCQEDVAQGLRRALPYCFKEHLYPGVPKFDLHIIEPYKSFSYRGVEVLPLTVMHHDLPILGFRIGPLAYITDCKTMPAATLEALRGVDTLVINALRYEPHHSHLSVDEAVEIALQVGARQTLFTHMSHDIGLASQVSLPPTMALAHDFMEVEVH